MDFFMGTWAWERYVPNLFFIVAIQFPLPNIYFNSPEMTKLLSKLSKSKILSLLRFRQYRPLTIRKLKQKIKDFGIDFRCVRIDHYRDQVQYIDFGWTVAFKKSRIYKWEAKLHWHKDIYKITLPILKWGVREYASTELFFILWYIIFFPHYFLKIPML